VATRPNAKLLHDDVIVRATDEEHCAAYVVVQTLRLAAGELALDLALQSRVAPRPAHRLHRAIRA
jgi:hypothetical protein